MNPEQQRIAIAEACGWKKMNWNEATVYGSPTHGFRVWKSKHQDSIMSYKGRGGERIPDYLNDLNAMNSAVLQKFNGPAHEGWAFIDNLRVACGIPHSSACMALVCATAAQRAEAFLKTLNLWTNES